MDCFIFIRSIARYKQFSPICLFAYCGLRESELISLRLVDVKLDEHFLNIFGKGSKARQVVINQITYDALKEYLEERNIINTENPYLFVSNKSVKTTKPFHRSFCNTLLASYEQASTIKNLHPNKLRSYFCTNALHNAGYTIDQVANQAGHSSLNTTKSYLINNTNSLLELSNKL